MRITVERHPLQRREDVFERYLDLSYESFPPLYDILSTLDTKNYVNEMMEIQALKVNLTAANPVDTGLQTFHTILVTIQQNKDRLAEITNEAYRDLAVWNDGLYHVMRFYSFNRNVLLEDPMVSDLKNRELQTAAIDRTLNEIVDARVYCEHQVDVIKMFLKQCDNVYNNLKSTNDNISRQITVIDQQMAIGEIKKVY